MSSISNRRQAAAASRNPTYLQREKDIREAAGRVFLEKGFHAANLADIAAEVGIDRATLYYYVESKHKLFRDIVSDAVQTNIRTARQVLDDESMTSTEKLTRIIVDLMVSFETHHPFLHVFVQEDISKMKRRVVTDADSEQEWIATMEEWNDQYRGAVKEIIRRGVQDGSFVVPAPPGVITNFIIGTLNSSQLWYSPSGPLDADDLGHSIATMVINGLSPRGHVGETGAILGQPD